MAYISEISYNTNRTGATLLSGYNEDSYDVTALGTDYFHIVTIDGSAVTHDLTITGNKFSNKITGSSQDDTIDGGAGADTIFGGDGNDSIFGGTGNDSIFGGTGNDSIFGGTGNDTLTGGNGADTFVYASGGGKDVITDYSSGDKIRITSGSISRTSYSGKDVIFKIGSGTLTVKNGKGKRITVNSSTKSYNIAELFAENNFATADNLSSIVENKLTATDYKLTTQNFENLTQENLITFAEK